MQIFLFSSITGTTHNFTNIREWQSEMGWGRIYAGFHYHNSIVKGLQLGHKVAHNVVKNYFRPVGGKNDRDDDDSQASERDEE